MMLVGRGWALEHVDCDVREERKGRDEQWAGLRRQSMRSAVLAG